MNIYYYWFNYTNNTHEFVPRHEFVIALGSLRASFT